MRPERVADDKVLLGRASVLPFQIELLPLPFSDSLVVQLGVGRQAPPASAYRQRRKTRSLAAGGGGARYGEEAVQRCGQSDYVWIQRTFKTSFQTNMFRVCV